jgi:hypothetical protein
MRSQRLWGAVFLGACLALVGCGSNGIIDDPVPLGPSGTTDLTGTWKGTFTIPGESSAVAIRSWTAAQSGASVTGTALVVADQGSGQEALVPATLSGTVSGTQLTSARFTVAAGAIAGLAACSITGTGTLTATATSISGPLSVVIAPNAEPCVGADGISKSATGTWTFSLTK